MATASNKAPFGVPDGNQDERTQADGTGAPPSLVGTVINGRYRVLERVAAGGMGVVYKAEQMPLGRAVALKVLQTGIGGEDDENTEQFKNRFFLEAAAAAKLTHPNTVVVFDYGAHEDQTLYIAMEFLDGRTLQKDLAKGGPMPPARALRISLQICSALRDAHAAGMVHRDIKPGNVMLTTRGADGDFVKVMDFGLVKVVDSAVEKDLTHTGAILGSPRYMSPEQIQSKKVDHRSDIYSFGAVLYHMLTGRPPFTRGASFNILAAHVNEPPPRFRETYPECEATPRLEAMCLRCLAKTQDERFQSMDEVLAEIQSCFEELGMTMTQLSLTAGVLPAKATMELAAKATSARMPATTGTVRADTSETSLAQPGKPNVAVFLAIGAIALASGVGAALLLRRSSASANGSVVEQQQRPTAPNPPPVDPQPRSNGQENSRAGTNNTPPPAVAPAPVRLVSDPAGAHVRRNGVDLGDTPLPLAIPAGEQWTVEISANGFVSRTLQISAGQGEVNARLDAERNSGGGRPVHRGHTPPRPTTPTGNTAATPPPPQPTATPPANPQPAQPHPAGWGANHGTTDNRDPWAQ